MRLDRTPHRIFAQLQQREGVYFDPPVVPCASYSIIRKKSQQPKKSPTVHAIRTVLKLFAQTPLIGSMI